MSGEVSYFSRFFVKFVEIIAAGLASAMCAYLLAHFAGLLSSPTPASAPALTHVQVDPTASGVAARSTPPLAASAANEHPAPQQDAPEAKLAPKAGKGPKVLPPSKHTKPDTSGAEKERRSQESAEAQVRAALANVDAKRRVPVDPVIESGLNGTRSVPVENVPPRQASVPSHQPDVGPRPDISPRLASEVVPPAANVPLQPVQPPSGATSWAEPVNAQQVKAGVLTCDVAEGMGYIIGSHKLLACSFTPEGAGRREGYDGSITKFGLDLGLTRGGFMVWSVFTNTVAGPDFLAGDYVGASGEITVAAGLGANVLVGGSNRTVALQPISLGAQTGLNFAIGVAALHLGLPRQ
jgi:hypothetical protein